MNTARMRLWVFLGSWLVLAVGCDRTPPEFREQTDQEEPSTVRVVSLAPTLTKMVVDMGWSKVVVGTASNDAAAPSNLPVVGTYTDVHTESLLQLRPTHVLMMTGKEGVPAALQQLADSGRFDLITYPTPTSVAELMQILFDPSELLPTGTGRTGSKSLGAVFGGLTEALELSNRLSIQIAQLNEVTSKADHRPRVLMVIATNPMMASGPDTVHDELLDYAGGRNAAAGAQVPAPIFDREKMIEAKPDVILLLLPGAPPLLGIDKDPRLAELRGLPIPAVESGRIALIDDPLVLIPSTSLPAIGVQMAKHIHPDLAEQIDQAMASESLPPSDQAPSDQPPDAIAPELVESVAGD